MHNTYISPGIVDGAVAHEQAQRRRDDIINPESTTVHAHRYGEPCNDKCKVYLTTADEEKQRNG